MDDIFNEAEDPKKPEAKHLPYVTWEVAGKEHKLKLTGKNIAKLEEKFNDNILTIVMNTEGLPPLSFMLTVIQAGAQPYDHGVSLVDMYDIYDKYIEEGGDQEGLLSDVLLPLLSVSGFFTESQTKSVKNMAEDIKSPL